MVDRATIKRYVPRVALRLRLLLRYRAFRRAPGESIRFLVKGRELDNFTYDIANRDVLAQVVARACGLSEPAVAAAIAELDDDTWLRGALDARLRGRRDRLPHMEYGRRLGWYAIVRLTKPTLVVETGVHDGLGSSVLLRALARNAAEGVDGRLVSFDVRPDVGWLIPDELKDRQELVIGDSLRELPRAVGNRKVDLFLHDSDHRYEYEMAELEAVRELAGPRVVFMSDNSHSCTAMRDFCERYGYPFDLFIEVPREHFYPGAGIGLSMPASRSTG